MNKLTIGLTLTLVSTGLHFLFFFLCRLQCFPLDDLGQVGAVHAELSLGAFHLEPPPEEILHHVAVTEDGPVPGTV